MGRFGANLVESEEETQAQNEVAFGLLSLLLVYPASSSGLCSGIRGDLSRWR